MRTFLNETLESLLQDHQDLSTLTLILPSKRAGGFLKNEIRQRAGKTQFAPRVISIEEYIEELSGLQIIEPIELLFRSFEAYQKTEGISEKEDFDTYASWGQTLLNDFNEIDRYLVDTQAFFTYLSSIKTLERWNLTGETTSMVQNFLSFWSHLPALYANLQSLLREHSLGYQGMVYREAANKVNDYANQNFDETFIFIGFNALNHAEQAIITTLLEAGRAEIYWDIDTHFLNDTQHGASLFLRQYLKGWKYYEKNSPKGIGSYYQDQKQLQIVAAQKNVAQAKYVGDILNGYSEEKLTKTAIVLADEHLLMPVLQSLPPNVKSVNVTMGAVLKQYPASVFFELLFNLHLQGGTSYYFKDVLALLNHNFGRSLLSNSGKMAATIQSQNKSHLSWEEIKALAGSSNTPLVDWLFKPWTNSEEAITACLEILDHCRNSFQAETIDRAVLHRLYGVFSQLQSLNAKYRHFATVHSASSIYTETVSRATLDFEGDAYSGLQIMGVLETRVLDFENVIVLSVNEGVLPTGKSNSSFITYDLKKEFNLPLYTEKDAIYTYHFYHMLQRAKEITLLHTTQAEGLSAGEKSRFLLQLEIESPVTHSLKHTLIAPTIPISAQSKKQIEKTPAVLDRIRALAAYGFSPSALTSYIRNPIDFYYDKILRLKEAEEVEETVAANTLGTIVHDTLENFYKPIENTQLTIAFLNSLKPKIHDEVTAQFEKTYRHGTFDKGKNLIIFEVAKRYVSNFINLEISEIEKGNTIEIVSVENMIEASLDITELDFPVKIRGKVDRIDFYNGQLRIIDYKTGSVNPADLNIVDWELLTTDYKYSKAFQVLSYALMTYRRTAFDSAEAGIISFKKLQAGFLPFAQKEAPNRTAKDTRIDETVLQTFEKELVKLICEITSPEVPFIEKKV